MRAKISGHLQAYPPRSFAAAGRRLRRTGGLRRIGGLCVVGWLSHAGICTAQPPIVTPQASASAPPKASLPTACLESGDGYLRAHLGGAIDARIDWPNSGTRCQGEPKDEPHGVRLSFQRASAPALDLLFVFGITGVKEGKPARAEGVNLTVIVQGTNRIYGTLGDSRCTVDSLAQRPLKTQGSYRVEARGFCTQPAHALRGKDALLVSTFEFAGVVTYHAPQDDTVRQSARTSH
jgi:hypothetical protein